MSIKGKDRYKGPFDPERSRAEQIELIESMAAAGHAEAIAVLDSIESLMPRIEKAINIVHDRVTEARRAEEALHSAKREGNLNIAKTYLLSTILPKLREHQANKGSDEKLQLQTDEYYFLSEQLGVIAKTESRENERMHIDITELRNGTAESFYLRSPEGKEIHMQIRYTDNSKKEIKTLIVTEFQY